MWLHGVVIFIHIMLLVFWLGTDVGVFLLAKFAQKPIYSMEQRALCLKAAMLLDMPPRICMVLALPTGVWLAQDLNLLHLSPSAMIAVVVFSLLWLGVVVTGIAKQGSALGAQAKDVERILLYLLAITLLGLGISSFFPGLSFMAPWLALKVIALGLIAAGSQMIDRRFTPGIIAFQTMMQNGSTPDQEAILGRSFDKTFFWVLFVYAMVVVAAFMGTVKPF